MDLNLIREEDHQKMPNIHNKTKDIKLETSVKKTNEEDSLSKLKEEIKKLKEQNY